uniref:Uncharacterized protein n=1 Tax=Arundo donax TaxID=35708 RepID=A0A0A9CLC8_ARUDO
MQVPQFANKHRAYLTLLNTLQADI